MSTPSSNFLSVDVFFFRSLKFPDLSFPIFLHHRFKIALPPFIVWITVNSKTIPSEVFNWTKTSLDRVLNGSMNLCESPLLPSSWVLIYSFVRFVLNPPKKKTEKVSFSVPVIVVHTLLYKVSNLYNLRFTTLDRPFYIPIVYKMGLGDWLTLVELGQKIIQN